MLTFLVYLHNLERIFLNNTFLVLEKYTCFLPSDSDLLCRFPIRIRAISQSEFVWGLSNSCARVMSYPSARSDHPPHYPVGGSPPGLPMVRTLTSTVVPTADPIRVSD